MGWRLWLTVLISSVGYAQGWDATPLDGYLSKHYTGKVPGAAVTVLREGKVLFAKGYGLADLDSGRAVTAHTRFELASVTKQFTAMSVMILKEAGRFAYDTPLVTFFPELRPFAKDVTIRHLLQHTAGFPGYEDELCARGKPITNADVVRFLVDKGRLDSPPGKEYSYSNTGYALLAVLVERASGLTYPEFLARHIFQPLGMNESFVNRWAIPPLPEVARSYSESGEAMETPDILNCNTVYGDGSIFSTVSDMASWDRALEKNKVLGTEAAMDEAYVPGKTADGVCFPYGFGWNLSAFDGMKEIWHTGSWAGFTNLNARFPDKRFNVVILSNQPGLDRDETLRSAIATYMLP